MNPKRLKTAGGKIAVAMSGGVDSSVTAALLQERGHEVLGLTMYVLDDSGESPKSSCEQSRVSNEAVEAARSVCQQLGIEHRVVDLRREFEDTVVQYFIDEYLSGCTPNPCVICNPTAKWGALLDRAKALGSKYFATGHYVQISYDDNRHRYVLRKGVDNDKEQSYALWRLSQQQLATTILPLGKMRKSGVREYAARRGLKTAERAESQEICFVPDDDYAGFISGRLHQLDRDIAEGDIVNTKGELLGKHRGYPYYTIGQRKGLGIALGRPAYVVGIDPQHNRIVVGDNNDLLASGLVADQANWVSVVEPIVNAPVMAKIRYNDPGAEAFVEEIEGDCIRLRFAKPQRAVTPGQSVVLYDGDELLGGAIICSRID